MTEIVYLKPCPFCGNTLDPSHPDTIYPSGTVWRFNEEIGCRTYHSHSERRDGDGACWLVNCDSSGGGCGAEVHGDSMEDAVTAWNRRAK